MRRLLLVLAPFIAAMAAAEKPAVTAAPLARDRFIAEMEAEFRRMDADRSGQLSPAEIARYQKARAEARAEAENRAKFTELDTNRNGQLSRAEFAKMRALAQAPDAQPMISAMDSSRDGSISMAEHRAATLANFDRLDRNRDGKVSAEEMKAGGLQAP